MGTVVHDKGISRIVPNLKIEKGKWYLGFICPDCEAKIIALEDNTNGKDPAKVIGAGKFSIACAKCKADTLIFNTSDLISLRADEDGALPAKLKRLKPSNRPRQPIVKGRYSKANVTFGIRFLEDRPECALIVARCVATWSYIETQLAVLLASLLHIDFKPAAAIFLAIQNSRTQQQVLRAAAEVVLNEQDFELLEALMNTVASVEKERNDLVHGVYAGSMLIERGIAWASQKDYVGHTVTVWASNYQNMSSEALMSKTFIYEPEDLETVASKLEWLHDMISSIRGYYGSDNDVWRSERYRQLSAEPLLAAELSRMRADREETPKLNASPNRKGRKQ
ncbi:MAG: hypothetical protein ACLQIQ_16355 [Beijerinckiaceae bacterium]